jgi:CHAT domain-containing protein
MTREASRCADPEVLAAFVAGNLSGAELETTIEHLRVCPDCRRVVGEGARFERGESRPRRISWWVAIAAAALGGIGLLAWSLSRAGDRTDPRARLISAMPREGRDLEPRLAGGFPWAPLRTIRRDSSLELDSEQMKLVGVAGEVLQRTRDDSSADARHAAAVARLLVGRPADAAGALAALAASLPRDPNVWSDLAAARYAASLQSGDASLLASALAAADAALRLDPRSPEALFNRALIVERLGLRDQARAAWNAYLVVDRSSEWAREAEQHLRGLGNREVFRNELERDYPTLVRNEKAARSLVQRFPQESRVWGESEILSRWGRSVLAGNVATADQHLRLARVIGDELARTRGEEMLRMAVQSIDASMAADRMVLAKAHVDFREAQKIYREGGPKLAEPRFHVAAAGFEAGRSPMALTSRYFAANTMFDQGRLEESCQRLEQVLAGAAPGFVAHSAQTKWQLGMVFGSLGRWGQSMTALQDSIATFNRLGEKNYEMAVREILAEVYDRIGEPREAWDQRLTALQELGRAEDMRLQVAVHAVARGAAIRDDWAVALAFLDLQIAMPRFRGDELIFVETLLSRARAARHMGLRERATNDLMRVTTEMRGIADEGLRERAEAERLAVRGFLASSPESTVTAVSQAIEFHQARGRRMFLPELYLQRGRALVDLGRHDEAGDEFEAGIRELEAQRLTIDAGDRRWGMFGVANALFDEAVALALRNGDEERAFSYSDRSRARELVDPPGANPKLEKAPQTLPVPAEHDVVVEYLLLPTRLVIFVVDARGIRVVQREVRSEMIADEVDHLTRVAISGGRQEFVRLASKMYDRLLGPIENELASDRRLVVVPDGPLSHVPFAALVDRTGRHVVERRVVVISPSVAAYGRARLPRTVADRPQLLLVAGPDARDGDAGRLTAQRKEMDAVAAEYEGVDYAAKHTDRADLQKRARGADVIHFVGHAVMPADNQRGALVTSRHVGAEAQLDVREIATMQLTRPAVVVLAACGTARSHGRAGDASISLARAFLAAGVPRVVATLWPIDDRAAAEFFPRLHHHFARGVSPAEALRAAQLEWVRADAPPGVWASVQIIGR